MANDNSIKVYPRIPSKNWWDLRKKAIQSPPKQVTASYLQTVLEIGEGAARNLLPGLRTVGLIDDNGESTPLMNDWRDDEHYPEVCKNIFEKIYPEELRSALPGPKPDRNQVKRWFARQTSTGDAAANQMAAFYVLLCEPDPKKANDESSSASKGKTAQLKKPTRRNKGEQILSSSPRGTLPYQATLRETSTTLPETPFRSNGIPSLHIDIQIHISADASADQIDQVFSSMGKHLYGKE